MSKPLENVKILDLSRVLAGPFCTMLLSDLGAEVIKVEMPEKGDDSRQFGPFKNGRSLYFMSINRGKKSISLNLKNPKGKEILLKLVKNVDVLVENFRPGTMEKLGIGWDILHKTNPKLIYAASSGFGHTGPYSNKPSYDILAQAMGGIMSITGWPEINKPTRVGMSIGDITASLFTAIGINAALYQRTFTGLGQKIDISMLDCQLAILENAMLRYQVEGKPPKPIGNRHPTITPFQAFKAKDDYFVIGIGNDNLWIKLCEVIDYPELINDPRFINNKNRTTNIDILIPLLENIFATKTVNEWCELFENSGIPHSPINTIDKVMENPQLKARNMFAEVFSPETGKVIIAGNPIKMSSIPDETNIREVPEIGQHNIDIYTHWLGLSEEDIINLKKEGVI